MIAGRLASGVSVAAASREKKGELTVGELWKLYFAYISKTNKRPDSTQLVWDAYVARQWSARRLSEVSANEVERWHLELPQVIMKKREEKAAAVIARKDARRAEIVARQTVRRHGPDPKPRPEKPNEVAKKVTGKGGANSALEMLRAMYSFALDAKRGYFNGANPAAKHRSFPAQERERFLQPDEIGPLFEALAAEPNESMRDVILIALLTGQRRANVLAMRWVEVHLDRAEWRISGELMKNGLPHLAPLVPEAVELLRRRWEARTATSEFIFPSTRSKSGHIGAPTTAWRRIMNSTKLPDLIFHDLRRTLGSWQAREGSSLVLIGKSLNHKTPEATAIYARLDIDPVRQSVVRATSSMFAAAGVKPVGEVIALPQKSQTPETVAKRGGNLA